MGYAELIKEEEDITNIMRDVEIIEKESIRDRDIVQQLLEFARKRPLEIRQVDVNSMIRDVVSLITVQVKDVRNKIIEQYAGIPPINGDPNQLKQVMLNLVKNALEATEDQGAILVSSGTEDGQVWFSVQDTGKGMSEECRKRSSTPFTPPRKRAPAWGWR